MNVDTISVSGSVITPSSTSKSLGVENSMSHSFEYDIS